jgi:hypothetical protein
MAAYGENLMATHTARFDASLRQGGAADAVVPQMPIWAGIVDFATRRAIVRVDARAGVLRARRSPRTIYEFCEGPSMAGAMAGSGWMQVGQQLPDGPLREPHPLRFLDFLRQGSVTDQRVVGEEDVRGVPTRHAALAVELDRSVWPQPNPREPEGGLLKLARPLAVRFNDPRPWGRLAAELWIDQEGRIRRVGWALRKARNARGDMWMRTELWDFGSPVAIADRSSQPAIDPVTMNPI